MSPCVQEHAGDVTSVVLVQILDIREDLIKVSGVDRLLIELFLHHIPIILGVNDKGLISFPQRYVSLHRGEEINDRILWIRDIPLDMFR